MLYNHLYYIWSTTILNDTCTQVSVLQLVVKILQLVCMNLIKKAIEQRKQPQLVCKYMQLLATANHNSPVQVNLPVSGQPHHPNTPHLR